ncbi:MAG: thioredoxin-dependent thiol peroxidase [Elusimicrobia bacterium]|nr:thioredoxin-dependent thiol peroxidase [Elusimicrobiota bacterium]
MAIKAAAELQVGDAAPAFETTDEAGRSQSLKQYRGKTVVLYFYPKDHTSGCTVEACDFRDNHEAFLKKGAVVLGVSPDPAKSHRSFKEKHALPFPLLLDEDRKICQAYGVWKEKSMYGRKYLGVERSTFVIGPDGRLRQVLRKVKVPEHVRGLMGAL